MTPFLYLRTVTVFPHLLRNVEAQAQAQAQRYGAAALQPPCAEQAVRALRLRVQAWSTRSRSGLRGDGEWGWSAAGVAQRVDPGRRYELRTSAHQPHVPAGVVDQPVADPAEHDQVGECGWPALLPREDVVDLAPRRWAPA